MTAVEYLANVWAVQGTLYTEDIEQAKEMEKQNLIDMSVMSALHERKWMYEEMSGKKYKAEKVEIRDLKETALEHYKETFKPE